MTTPIKPLPLPPQVSQILAIINLALQFAPVVEGVYNKARDVFDMWFASGLITVEQQNALHSWNDQHEADVLAGKVPVAWQIDPDPE